MKEMTIANFIEHAEQVEKLKAVLCKGDGYPTSDALKGASQKCEPSDVVYNKSPYEVGKQYFVQTVTYFYLGQLSAEYGDTIVLSNASWIPDTGRYNEFISGQEPKEVEPCKNPVIIHKGALLSATLWEGTLPNKPK